MANEKISNDHNPDVYQYSTTAYSFKIYIYIYMYLMSSDMLLISSCWIFLNWHLS